MASSPSSGQYMKQQKYEQKTAVNERVDGLMPQCSHSLCTLAQTSLSPFPSGTNHSCGDPFGCEPLMCSQKGSYCMPIGEAEEF